MGSGVSVPEPEEIPQEQRSSCLPGLKAPDLNGVIELLRSGKIHKIACLCGAGISVSAGIPDFRTPGTGLYSQLEKYELPRPEAVFDLQFFKDNPKPFCTLAKEMFPGRHRPTTTHAFLKLLQDKGLLLRCYTQNIDTLERVAGIEPDRLVEAHGSFASVSCVECRGTAALRDYREQIDQSVVPRCGRTFDIVPPNPPPTASAVQVAKEEVVAAMEAKAGKSMADMSISAYMDLLGDISRAENKVTTLEAAISDYPTKHANWQAGPKTRVCGGLLKSNIVFFGEQTTIGSGDDLAEADLLIIMGTSLQVMPFANLIGRVSALCPRLLINRDYVGSCEQHDPPMGFGNVGLRCGRADNYRDVFLQSDCDAAVQRLCTKLGWVQELEGVLKAVQAVPPEEAWLSLVREDACARGGGQPEAGVGITPSSHSTTAKETAAQPASTAATPIHPRSRSPGTSSVETKKPLRSDGGKLPSKGLSPAKNQKINRTEQKKPPAAVASRQGKKSQPAKPVLPVLPASRQPLGTAAPLYDPLRAAADCIMAADAILICSGAGMGVDSGLGTYRGINAGNFGIDYEIICQPKWFQSHPDLAWGFWGRCYHAYTSATLHDGYGLLCAWGKRAPLGCFSVTSNVDGHWLRSGIGAERVWEVHGSVHQLQVDNILSSYEEVWASDADGAMSALELPAWELQPGQQVGVQLSLDGKWSDAQVAPDGRTILIKHTGKETSNVYGLRTQRDKDNNWAPDSDLLRVKPGCAFPGCPDAAQPPPDAEGQVMAKEEARPNILMFNDGDFKSSRVDAQKKVYYEWSEGLPPETKLAVIEIGVGTVIPKIRAKAELATHDFKNSTLIRINMGDFENVLNGTPGENGEKTERRICINMGALAALQGIDQFMQPVVKKSGTVAPSNSSNSLVRTSSVERQHASSVGTKISLLSGGVSKKASVKKVTTKNKAARTNPSSSTARMGSQKKGHQLRHSKPPLVDKDCFERFARHGGRGSSVAAAAAAAAPPPSYVALGGADYRVMCCAAVPLPGPAPEPEPASGQKNGPSQLASLPLDDDPDLFAMKPQEGQQPDHQQLSVMRTMQQKLASREWDAASLRFLDLGCGDGEILQVIHDKLGVKWPNLWGVSAEDLRGIFNVDVKQTKTPISKLSGFHGFQEERDVYRLRVAETKKLNGREDLRKSAPAEWNARNYVVHDIQSLELHEGLAAAVQTEGKFHCIVSWTTFCHVLDTLGAIEMVYNDLLLSEGGLFLANGLAAGSLAAAPSDTSAVQPFAQLAAILRTQGYDIRVYEEAHSTKGLSSTIFWAMKRHKTSPKLLELSSLVQFHPQYLAEMAGEQRRCEC